MRNTYARPAVAVLIFAAMFATLGAKAPKKDKDEADKADIVEVSLKNLSFIPESVTIKVGQTVRWTNNDNRDYLLVARDNTWKSENLRPKDTFEHKFTEVGSIEYSCAIHPRLIGTVVVEEKK